MLNPERGDTPLLLKIAPDLGSAELDELLAVCHANRVAAIIATNTTLDHNGVASAEEGGLSGAPLRTKSTNIVRQVAAKVNMPIIGCGGILDIASAREKIEAGATLLQIYTGFVYRGPALIRELAQL